MKVLGLYSLGDSAAATIIDGKVHKIAEEERWTRRKHSRYWDEKRKIVVNDFPKNAVRYVLGIKYEPDIIVFPWDAPKFDDGTMLSIFNSCPFEKGDQMLRWEANVLKQQSTFNLRKKISKYFTGAEVKFVSHHLAHAASAYYFSGFERCAVITADAHGDQFSTVIWHATPEGIEMKESYVFYNSLGWIYSAFTCWLGFKYKEGEGKVLGLAAYGRPVYDVPLHWNPKDQRYFADPTYSLYGEHSSHERFTDDFVKAYGPAPLDPLELKARNVAASIQTRLEFVGNKLASKAMQFTGESHIAAAGGIFLNVGLNEAIANICKNLFVFPQAHDAGTAIGAALIEHPTFERLRHVFYGPEYDSRRIKNVIERFDKYIAESYRTVQPNSLAADLIADGFIVGWFQGRMEIGPRALGGRSLLADPTRKEIWIVMNSKKGREWWRPLAPTMTEDFAQSNLIGVRCRCDEFMLSLKKVVSKIIPAVTHVDGTTRPQIITDDGRKSCSELKRFYDVLRSVEEKIGIPCVVNTSFNVAGKPIVMSPSHALEDAIAMGIHHVILGNWYVRLR